MSDSQTVSASYLRGCSEELGKGFWQEWQQYRDYLHRCCIKWMGGNPTDAEDALSRAMLKAWEKVQKYATGEISNFKAWLTTLTRNLCVDIYRERSRGANRVEDIEGYARSEEQGLVRSEDTPYCAMETDEKRIVIRRAIDNLPTRLRETFILHFYKELSYPEIVQQQEISYDNVCKRLSQARKILREELRRYFIEEEGTDTDKSVPPTATESAIGEMSEGNAPVEAGAEETVTLPEAVEEVESVEGSEAIEVGRDMQHSESVMVAVTNNGKLEVKSDRCRGEFVRASRSPHQEIQKLTTGIVFTSVIHTRGISTMPGLTDLSQKEVENVFSYALQKIKTDDLLDAFEGTLKQLYDVEDYKGGWQTDVIDAAVKNYIAKTDAIKEDYRDKKITHIAASSVNIVGGILSFTPLAPVGWGMLGLGTATNAVTDVVDLLDRSKQNDWNSAKDALRGFVEDPFQGTTFGIVYQSLMTSYAKIRSSVSTDDYSILLQGLGWNYFVFRKDGKSHEKAIQELKTTLELFRTHRYTISTDLKLGKQSAIQDIQNQIKPSFNNLLSNVGALAMMGLAAGLSIGAITAGINIASATFNFAETIAHGLLAIGNFASRALDFMLKAGPAVAIVGGVISIVFDAIALANIDETFKPYYDFKDECVKLLDQYRVEYLKNDQIIVEMIKFMKEKKEVIQPA